MRKLFSYSVVVDKSSQSDDIESAKDLVELKGEIMFKASRSHEEGLIEWLRKDPENQREYLMHLLRRTPIYQKLSSAIRYS